MSATKDIFRGLAVLTTLIMLQGQAFAQEDTMAAAPASDNVPVFSGGIGDDEIDYIKSVQHEYDTKLLFTEANGAFLSDLSVTITDKKGQAVVSTVTKGPILLVNLPAGNYTVTALQGDLSRDQKISVSGKGTHTYQFRFPGHDLVGSENN